MMWKGALVGGVVATGFVAARAFRAHDAAPATSPTTTADNGAVPWKAGAAVTLAGAGIGFALDRRAAHRTKSRRRFALHRPSASDLVEAAKAARPALEHAIEVARPKVEHAAEAARSRLQAA